MNRTTKILMRIMMSAVAVVASLALFGVVTIDPIEGATGVDPAILIAIPAILLMQTLILSGHQSRWTAYYDVAVGAFILLGVVYYFSGTVGAIVFALLSAITAGIGIWYLNRDY